MYSTRFMCNFIIIILLKLEEQEERFIGKYTLLYIKAERICKTFNQMFECHTEIYR